jgi:hypothetical protein
VVVQATTAGEYNGVVGSAADHPHRKPRLLQEAADLTELERLQCRQKADIGRLVNTFQCQGVVTILELQVAIEDVRHCPASQAKIGQLLGTMAEHPD